MAADFGLPVGTRFTAVLLFQFRVESSGTSDQRRTCEKRMVLLSAPDARAALRAAKQSGRRAQYQYPNATGGLVHFEFIGVLDLLRLGPECEADEVWYVICDMVKPMERRGRLVPPDSELRAIAEEKQGLAERRIDRRRKG
jgi:hypothetical protein